jgi:outer membrane protein TolC
LGQEIQLTDSMPQQGLPAASLETSLQTAMANRADSKRAEALVQSARQSVDSAKAENLPKIDLNADYGDLGPTPANSHGTFTVKGALTIPVFNFNHSKSDQDAAKARLQQRQLEYDDLKGRIEMDVRSSFLDLRSSEDQVKVAQSSLDLAHKELDQAQDRFESGVADNLEVIQAQETVALADETLISSLYSLNVAKAGLARAMGVAEQSIKTYLGGKQ